VVCLEVELRCFGGPHDGETRRAAITDLFLWTASMPPVDSGYDLLRSYYSRVDLLGPNDRWMFSHSAETWLAPYKMMEQCGLTEEVAMDQHRPDRPSDLEIFEEAIRIAAISNPDRTWREWTLHSLNACEDFWTTAQMQLDVPSEEWRPMPKTIEIY